MEYLVVRLADWQVDLILDALSVLEDLEGGNGTNADYDGDPIAQTIKALGG